MSNLTDFIGSNAFAGGECSQELITDGVNTLTQVRSHYVDNIKYEVLSSKITARVYDSLTNGIAFNDRYVSGANIIVPFETTVEGVPKDFIGIECDKLKLEGIIGRSTGTDSSDHVSGFCGTAVNAFANGASGTNMMNGVWNFMPRGGNGGNYSTYTGGAGGVGFSGSGGGEAGHQTGGGGLVLVIANEIFGNGTFLAAANVAVANSSGTGERGGGGIVIIATKKWAGTNSIDVSGWQDGSYAILKINSNSSLTLMVHSQNGVSAPLNGQTPVFGKFANVPYDTTTPLTPSSVSAGTPISVSVAGSATVDSRAIHGTSESPYLTYASSDIGIATVDGDGLVTGVAAGTCTITATSVIDGTKSNTTTITVA